MTPAAAGALLDDAKGLVRELVDDLRDLVDGGDPEAREAVEREYKLAKDASRTALAPEIWAEGWYAQVAVAWVLAAVFVRFCEDNDLGLEPLLAGPGRRRDLALDQRAAYVRENPDHDDRDWLREIVGRYRALPATGELFGDHNPIWLLAPSADGARTLVQAFQAVHPDSGDIRHDFTDSSWDTRFLGDLYQDLSEHAKKTYALLQTPEFVEEFILSRTFDPALATFGLRDTTLIDPTCGSGHFLLGAFHRLFARWQDAEPGANPRALARRALEAIAGVDSNAFAVAIARFRLLVAALKAGDYKSLVGAPTYAVNVAVGDSLLHGNPPGRLEGTLVEDELVGAAGHCYSSEDFDLARSLLNRKWHAVVGNPPYITVKDPALNRIYRDRFSTCRGKYSLGVPYTEQFFHLARSEIDPERCGYVGMITANSFMKRDMGKTLIEQWMPAHDLTHVIDTSGAYVPGHGTPTVIFFGRHRAPVQTTVRAVMGIRGEPSKPAVAEKGFVWSSIVDLIEEAEQQNEYVSVVDLERTRLHMHPWSIGGGGASELKELLDQRGGINLGTGTKSIGFHVITGADEFFLGWGATAAHRAVEAGMRFRPLGTGEDTRDWQLHARVWAVFPYDDELRGVDLQRPAWPVRRFLETGLMFGKTRSQRGLSPTEYVYLSKERERSRLSIVFAFVATHNHFVLDRGGKVFNQSAPVITLPEGIDEPLHLALIGLLNSSTACFWMKQVFHGKGNGGVNEGYRGAEWEEFWELDGTKLKAFPLPADLDPTTATLIDQLAHELGTVTPEAIAENGTPTAEGLKKAERRYHDIRSRMIAGQERLDWEVYRRYGLVDEDLTTGDEPEPPLKLGERAFEIVLARKMAAGDEESSWFQRHGSTPITELPAHWPDDYRRLVERRIELIGSDRNIGLIERPEHKRRWAAEPWDKQVKTALRGWLLDRLEDPRYWPEPAALTSTARLAAEARTDAEFVAVAQLYVGREDVDIAPLVQELARAEAVPYLAAFRYTDAGMRKHQQWLATWELQRREDDGEQVGAIPVPPKYTKADFQGVAWDHRGKLDVPKERFVSYPGAERDTDPSLVVGWAGWDHLARARALATWYLQAKREGRDLDHLTPLLAGLAELVPWLRQWYDQPDPDLARSRPGSQIAALVDSELRAHHLTADLLTAWRPPNRHRSRSRSRGGRNGSRSKNGRNGP